MKKHTFEEVKKYFEEAGCELLQNTYENVMTSMKYRCKCENIAVITFCNFRKGKRCAECGGTKKHTFEYVKKYFEDSGCELLETEYFNSKASMKYICSCGEESKICFNNFKRGVRCMSCSGSEKYEFEYVKKYFSENSCELLETKYKNSGNPMKYRCNCGANSKICFSNFKNGNRCMECANEGRRHSFEDVKKYFLDADCELLETSYVNCLAKMKYRCSCGKESKICFRDFKRGHRCALCGYDKAAKTSVSFKDYTCPDGTVVKYQGYEHLALDELYASYDQADIENSRRNIPVINYEFKGNTCRYFPDIFIKSENKIVEVKSYYIYNLQLDKNILKRDATKRAGFAYEVWFYTPKKKGAFDKHII